MKAPLFAALCCLLVSPFVCENRRNQSPAISTLDGKDLINAFLINLHPKLLGESINVEPKRESLPATDDIAEEPEYLELTPIRLASAETVLHKKIADIYKFLGSMPREPWWMGPNICVEREEIDDSDVLDSSEGAFFTPISMNMQKCHMTRKVYECTTKEQSRGISRTKTVRYQCCHGFKRTNSECTKVDLLPLIDTIKQLNGSEFLKISQEIDNILLKENVTVFLPSDEAFKEFATKMFESDQAAYRVDHVRRRRHFQEVTSTQLLLNHITKGFVDIYSDETYQSLFDNSTLQIKQAYNSDDRRTALINCAKIISDENHAINGYVYKVDRVLVPVTKSIAEIFKSNPKFSMLNDILETIGLANSFNDETWTVFAPTNEAFDKLDSHIMKKFIKKETCVLNIVKHHMLSHAMCLADVQGGLKGVHNSIGDAVYLSLPNKTQINDISTENTQTDFLVNNIKVSQADIIATNGVIHAIDEIMIPESALPLSELLIKRNLTKFYDIIVKAGMQEEIENMSNVTFFIPIDKSLENIYFSNWNYTEDTFSDDNNTDEITGNYMETLRSFVLHHITPGTIQTYELVDGDLKKTMDDNIPVRINLYNTQPAFTDTYNRATVDCSRLLHFDNQQCNNIIHQIEKPLLKIEGTILEQVNSESQLSMLSAILPGTEIESILKSSTGITFIAPTNEAFEKMTFQDFQMLVDNPHLVNIMLKQHILKEILCCAGLHYTPWPFTTKVRAFNDKLLNIQNNKIGSATLTSCDIGAINGVIHLTNKVMIPSVVKNRPNHPNIDIHLYGIQDYKK